MTPPPRPPFSVPERRRNGIPIAAYTWKIWIWNPTRVLDICKRMGKRVEVPLGRPPDGSIQITVSFREWGIGHPSTPRRSDCGLGLHR